MLILKYLLLVVEVLVSFMLVGIILLQKSRDQGMGMAFGAGMGEAFFGSRTGNVLTRATIILSVVFLFNTLFIGMLSTHGRSSVVTGKTIVRERAVPTAPTKSSEKHPVIPITPPPATK